MSGNPNPDPSHSSESSDESEEEQESELSTDEEEVAETPAAAPVVPSAVRWGATPEQRDFDPTSTFSMLNRVLSSVCRDLDIPPSECFYFKGGCVRDMLRGRSVFADIDVVVHRSSKTKAQDETLSPRAFVDKFRSFMQACDRLRKEVMPPSSASQYSYSKLWIEHDRQLTCVDFTLRNAKLKDYRRQNSDKCDFTCNNLTMSPDGSIAARLKPPSHMSEYANDPAAWTLRCIGDCTSMNLVLMERVSREDVVRYIQMLRRQKKMLQKGYSYAGGCSRSGAPGAAPATPGFAPLLEVRTVRDAAGDAGVVDVCPICHDDFSAPEDTICLECNHVFHIECLEQTVAHRRDTCPVCRRRMKL